MVGHPLLLAGLTLTWATTAPDPNRVEQAAVHPAGRVVSSQGDLTLERDGRRASLSRGDVVQQGDVVATGEGGAARLLMRDRSLLNLGANTRLTVEDYRVVAKKRERRVNLRLWLGRLWATVSKSGGDRDYQITGDNAVAGVRGTELVVDVNQGGGFEVTVVLGSVAVGMPGGEMTLLGPMEVGAVAAGGAVAVNKTTRAAIAEKRRSVTPKSELGQAGAGNRLEAAAAAAPAEKPDSTPSSGNPTDTALQQLEPSTSKARVRGRVEVRD